MNATELFKYDAIIFGDVEADFFTHDQMVLMRRFVAERGGGFLMLGGAESFRQGNYAGTLDWLDASGLSQPASDARLPSDWKLTLTREGWLQPWTRLRSTEAEEQNAAGRHARRFRCSTPSATSSPARASDGDRLRC